MAIKFEAQTVLMLLKTQCTEIIMAKKVSQHSLPICVLWSEKLSSFLFAGGRNSMTFHRLVLGHMWNQMHY